MPAIAATTQTGNSDWATPGERTQSYVDSKQGKSLTQTSTGDANVMPHSFIWNFICTFQEDLISADVFP